MNITFFIGNGFDIAYGMQTSYKSFLGYYINIKTQDDVINEFKKMIEKNIEDWSDAEIAIGEATKAFTNRLDDYRKCFDDFIDQMSNYLQNQQSQVRDEVIKFKASKFKAGIINFYEKFPTNDRVALVNRIRELTGSSTNSNISFSFLIFNYTNLAERFIDNACETDGSIGYADRIVYGSKPARFKTVEYVHGKLSDPPLVMGVDNGSQIANIDFRGERRLTRSLVKFESNQAVRKIEYKRCVEILESSNIICIFGMSLGQTDKLWWKYTHKWMINNSKSILIIFWWDPLCVKSSVGSCIEAQERFKNVLYKNLGFTDEELKSIQERIFFAINTNLFGF